MSESVYIHDLKSTSSWTQLTAPGNTAAVLCEDRSKITIQYKVASINTNVVVRAEGSLDGTNYFNLDANELDTIQTANGTYAMTFEGRLKYFRFKFVSEGGGTDATIDAVYFMSV